MNVNKLMLLLFFITIAYDTNGQVSIGFSSGYKAVFTHYIDVELPPFQSFANYNSQFNIWIRAEKYKLSVETGISGSFFSNTMKLYRYPLFPFKVHSSKIAVRFFAWNIPLLVSFKCYESKRISIAPFVGAEVLLWPDFFKNKAGQVFGEQIIPYDNGEFVFNYQITSAPLVGGGSYRSYNYVFSTGITLDYKINNKWKITSRLGNHIAFNPLIGSYIYYTIVETGHPTTTTGNANFFTEGTNISLDIGFAYKL